MQFTEFGRTGLTVSRLGLGTGTFGKQTDEAESFRVFDTAADAGVNFIDTDCEIVREGETAAQILIARRRARRPHRQGSVWRLRKRVGAYPHAI